MTSKYYYAKIDLLGTKNYNSGSYNVNKWDSGGFNCKAWDTSGSYNTPAIPSGYNSPVCFAEANKSDGKPRPAC